MKDLIEFVWRSLAGYVPVFAGLVAAPKRTIAARLAAEDDRLARAIGFTGVTVALGLLLQAPLAGADAAPALGGLVAVKIVALLAGAAVVLGAFRLVGGRGGYEDTLIAYLYVVSPLYLALTLLRLMVVGVISGQDPSLARAVLIGGAGPAQWEALSAAAPTTAFAVAGMALGQVALAFGWTGACWGAYRAIHGVTGLQAVLAFWISAAAFVLVLMPVWTLVVRGMHGGAVPAVQ